MQRLGNSPQPWLLVLLVAAVSTYAAGKKAPAEPFSPTEITGMYSFLQDGEFVQVTIQPDAPAPQPNTIKVDGFVSRFGSDDSDKGLVLNQFFTSGELKGKMIHFVTRKVHSVWYEFKGTVERGTAESRADEGYFVINGTLTENRALPHEKTASRSRTLEMKLLPQMDDEQPQDRSQQVSPSPQWSSRSQDKP